MIHGKNITLRLFRETDLEEYVEMTENIMEGGEYWFGSPPSLKKVRDGFSKNGMWDIGNGTMLIVDKQGNKLGEIFFFKPQEYFEGFEIGYRIFRPLERGKGTMTEALRIFTAFLFGTKPIQRLQLMVAEGNIPSWKVAEKCGYTHEGTARKAMFSKGRYLDLRMYSI